MGHIPVGMERFQAANVSQWKYIERRIEECDYFIVIIAERYGSVDDSGVSYTQLEYEYADSCGIPVAAFPLDEKVRRDWPPHFIENDQREKIENFRSLVGKKLYKKWENYNDLSSSVVLTLNELIHNSPRPGWVKADFSAIDPLNDFDVEASHNLKSAVRRDLVTAGYYRKDQKISIESSFQDEKLVIDLVFEATIVPVRPGATVLHPSVNPPEGFKLMKCTYEVDGERVPKNLSKIVGSSAKDKIEIRYEAYDDSITEVADYHYWPSPVLQYIIRYNGSKEFSLQVGRTTGQRLLDTIPIKKPRASGCIQEFAGQSAALTAQGLKWSLSRSE